MRYLTYKELKQFASSHTIDPSLPGGLRYLTYKELKRHISIPPRPHQRALPYLEGIETSLTFVLRWLTLERYLTYKELKP